MREHVAAALPVARQALVWSRISAAAERMVEELRTAREALNQVAQGRQS